MAETRCDIASAGSQEIRVGAPSPEIPNADYVRVDMAPSGIWMASYDWGNYAYLLKGPTGGVFELGRRYIINSHAVRFCTDNTFHVLWIGSLDGVTNAGFRLRYAADGMTLVDETTFDATPAGSQGIRDIRTDGSIVWAQPNGDLVDGFTLLNMKERGDYQSGVLMVSKDEGVLGVSVFRKSTKEWFRAYPHDLFLIPGLADNGTVAVSANPGGFYPPNTWTKFDPHTPPDPDPGPDPTPTPKERKMFGFSTQRIDKEYDPNAKVVFVDVSSEDHPDKDGSKVIRYRDAGLPPNPEGNIVCCTPDGNLERRKAAGAWEKFFVSDVASVVVAPRDKGDTGKTNVWYKFLIC